ncbi:MAG: hypothetical protein ACLQED_03825 [Desulfobaccales bacterium]|jgi:hypothetical protein
MEKQDVAAGFSLRRHRLESLYQNDFPILENAKWQLKVKNFLP